MTFLANWRDNSRKMFRLPEKNAESKTNSGVDYHYVVKESSLLVPLQVLLSAQFDLPSF